mgnify:CR=1 FL=1
MTKETKIGLLVGLAFIILFAIILSEKGATRSGGAPTTLIREDTAKQPTRVASRDQPFGGAGEMSPPLPPVVPPAPANYRVPIDEPYRTAAASPEARSIPPLPPSVVSILNGSEDHTAAGPDHNDSGSLTVPEGGDGGVPPSPRVIDEEGPPPPPSGVVFENPSGPSGGLPSKPVAPDAAVTIHTVRPGQSLGKIAAEHYGRATPARIEAICQANRDVLRDPHKIRAGDKLRIPLLEEHGDQFELVRGFAPPAVIPSNPTPRSPTPVASGNATIRIPTSVEEQAASAAAGRQRLPTDQPEPLRHVPPSSPPPAPPARWQWYEVQKKDTLSSIAKRLLGNQGRADEIFELNRDVLTSKNTIKPGMKLRIPVKNSATPVGRTVTGAS